MGITTTREKERKKKAEDQIRINNSNKQDSLSERRGKRRIMLLENTEDIII